MPAPITAASPSPAEPFPFLYTPFLHRLVRFLLPYFLGVCPDLDSARAEILETLASYGARTRSELLNAAQIIAYGLSGLDVLHEAKTTEMSASLRLRYRGCANTLNRASQKNEQALNRRLAQDIPAAVQPAAEPPNDLPDSVVDKAIQEVQAKIETCRNQLSAMLRPTPSPAQTTTPPQAHPSPSPQATPASEAEQNKRLRDDCAMISAVAQMGKAVQPASNP
jgi:cell division septation protein DedD